jgi:3-phenylpropionate/trans-cinnamate dioxygenase ferredoxin subunit
VQGTAAPTKPGEYRWERAGEIIRCPWHGWEFDLKTGYSIFNPHKTRVRSYDVTVSTDEDVGVETYPVSIDEGVVILHF